MSLLSTVPFRNKKNSQTAIEVSKKAPWSV